MKRIKKIIQEVISLSEYNDLLIRKYAQKTDSTEKEKPTPKAMRDKSKVSS